jgi:L-ascorbate metabolism protein UlaG (beta-lactamase superfamily)
MMRLPALLLMCLGCAAPALAAEPGCRPQMAQFPFSTPAPRVMKAALKPDELKLTFVGHASFLIESPAGARAVTDYNDFVRAAEVPDIATMNKAHSTHFSRNPEPSITHLLPGWNPAGGRAEHDLKFRDLRVRNVSTNIRNWSGGTEYDGNSIFVFELGDFCVVHLGHLHHTLEPTHIRAIGRADVVLVPVDSGFTMDIEGMFDVLKALSPRVIIPMHFFGPQTLERFISLGADTYAIDRRATPVVTLSRESLPDKPTMIVLPGR